jgi:hypothetical protein
MPRGESERALVRLEQLAREERAAVEAGDVDAICRISLLLPDATERAVAGDYGPDTRLAERVEAIQSSHRAAEAFLNNRLAETREALRQLSGGKRIMSGYAGSSLGLGAVRGEG